MRRITRFGVVALLLLAMPVTAQPRGGDSVPPHLGPSGPDRYSEGLTYYWNSVDQHALATTKRGLSEVALDHIAAAESKRARGLVAGTDCATQELETGVDVLPAVSLAAFLRSSPLVATFEVMSSQPGEAGGQLASALGVRLVEILSGDESKTVIPQYVIYPGVELSGSTAGCVIRRGFQRLPRNGEMVVLILKRLLANPRTGPAFATMGDAVILFGSNGEPKGPAYLRELLPEDAGLLTDVELQEFVRGLVSGEDEGN